VLIVVFFVVRNRRKDRSANRVSEAVEVENEGAD
jgi:hypothetical protein